MSRLFAYRDARGRSASHRWIGLTALLTALTAACIAPPDVRTPPVVPELPLVANAPPALRSATTRAGTYQVTWKAVPSPIDVNEAFELEVRLERTDAPLQPLEGATLSVRAWMPDHGHGMVREPRSSEVSPGVYRVRGMLFHMGGLWELSIDVVHDNRAESADFIVEL